MRLRKAAVSVAELARRLDALERRYDARFREVFEALRGLMQPEPPPRKVIGFSAGESGPGTRGGGRGRSRRARGGARHAGG